MGDLLKTGFEVILLLLEGVIILLIIDAILSTLWGMLKIDISWKKVIIGAVGTFGLLWLKDFVKDKKAKKKEETIQALTEEDFEVVDEENQIVKK